MNLDLFDTPSEEPAGDGDREGSENDGPGRGAGTDDAGDGGSGTASAVDLEEERTSAAGETVGDPEGEEPRIWTVSEVNRAVRTLLEDTIPAVWIGGEVANWTRARSGHRYFTLKDEDAQLDCVMWRRDAARLPADPDEGTAVRAYGSLTLYEARGRYQLAVRRLEGDGADGLWRIAFEKLRKKLQEEGLLAEERKRPPPRFPERIGVVTSPTGAALRDILTVIRRRAPWSRVLLRGSRVQGEEAAEEIARALRVLGSSGRVDVIIVGRGGGSIEDLWAFNEEPVARAIAECPVPVVSAVGHEVDVTIADLVADVRAPTPSAAGEAVVPDASALLESLRGVTPRLSRCLRAAVERRWQRMDEGFDRLGRAVERQIAPRWERIQHRRNRLENGMRNVVQRRRQRLAATAGKVEALSPLSTMRRGYAVPLREGAVLRSVEDFPDGSEFTLRIVDGKIQCRVRESTREEVGGD